MTSVEASPALRGFVRVCSDGWSLGWHERNGGNLTYRMTASDVEDLRGAFSFDRPWVPMGVRDGSLAGEHFIVTGSGKYMRNAADDPAGNLGVLEIGPEGDRYRIVWGLENGARPTSEFDSHYLCHAVRAAATGGKTRVMYHAHPANIVALTFVLPLTAAAFSRALWQSETECPMVFPNGVGVVEWMVPGGPEIAEATRQAMAQYDAVVWAHHGLFTSGPDFDSAFGLMHTIEKAAQIRVLALSAGQGQLRQVIPDDGLRRVAEAYGHQLNESLLRE
ncbi:MAG: rhamnulose-1-phosphate aldolase [Oscillospiraceae bacterium]|nr:rhamnulose-1-phosphate aldolase [Oscillospiraceae bacterium]MBR4691277.1 rhamnulose-1-phosphate aldolase [Oscillospiraceae bacterium]